jgi:hypothetical protein
MKPVLERLDTADEERTIAKHRPKRTCRRTKRLVMHMNDKNEGYTREFCKSDKEYIDDLKIKLRMAIKEEGKLSTALENEDQTNKDDVLEAVRLYKVELMAMLDSDDENDSNDSVASVNDIESESDSSDSNFVVNDIDDEDDDFFLDDHDSELSSDDDGDDDDDDDDGADEFNSDDEEIITGKVTKSYTDDDDADKFNSDDEEIITGKETKSYTDDTCLSEELETEEPGPEESETEELETEESGPEELETKELKREKGKSHGKNNNVKCKTKLTPHAPAQFGDLLMESLFPTMTGRLVFPSPSNTACRVKG